MNNKSIASVFRTLHENRLRKIARHRDIKRHRMAAYGVLVNRRYGQRRASGF